MLPLLVLSAMPCLPTVSPFLANIMLGYGQSRLARMKAKTFACLCHSWTCLVNLSCLFR